MDRYGALLEAVKRAGLFDAYREGIRVSPPPPEMPRKIQEAAKVKIFEKYICLMAGQNQQLLKMLNNAAFEMLMSRLYRDMANGTDHATAECSVDDLFNAIRKQGKG